MAEFNNQSIVDMGIAKLNQTTISSRKVKRQKKRLPIATIEPNFNGANFTKNQKSTRVIY
jgi:hypothetical protein